ncbi:hypothetical protein EDD11_005485 [Mortierella claussenii]|nr:hypothetical protein EDD11_005485 [Mortierella claussenii]
MMCLYKDYFAAEIWLVPGKKGPYCRDCRSQHKAYLKVRAKGSQESSLHFSNMPTTKVILENVFGLLGIIFWSFQLLPQAIDNYKAKSTRGLSSSMFLLWTLAALGFGAYSIVDHLSIPIILQPHIFGFFSTTCFLQCVYYGDGDGWSHDKNGDGGAKVELQERNKQRCCSSVKWTKSRIVLLSVVLAIVLAGVEVAAVYGTRAGIDHNVKGTLDATGILPVILLGLGFLPQYYDIYKLRSVVGVSMVFITADAAGSVFSLISLAFRETFDLLAALNYVVVFVCDMIIVGLFVYFNKYHPALARLSPGEIEMDNEQEQEQGSSAERQYTHDLEQQSTSTTANETI